MSWLKNRRNQEDKKRLQKICFVSKTALNLAVDIYGWKNPATNLLGAVVIPPLTDAAEKLLNTWNVDPTLEDQYFSAVENSLARVELLFYNQHGKRKLVQELAECVDTTATFDMDLEEVILNTETYQEQYMTSIDVKEIVQCFDQAFHEEITLHKELNNYYTLKGTYTNLDMLKQIYILLNTDDEKLDNIYKYVRDIKDDTTQIKKDVQEIKNDMSFFKKIMLGFQSALFFTFEVLVHSIIIFFAFTIATAFFHVSINKEITIFIVILISEMLIHGLRVQLKERRTLWLIISAQIFFITTCVFMTTNDSGFYVLLCSIISVIVKYILLYHKGSEEKTNDNDND